MNIYSKGYALQPRQLRRFTGKNVILFDGHRGKIEFPYLMIKETDGFHPMLVENERVFHEIRRIENGKTVIAERRSARSPLLTTGKGVNQYAFRKK